MTFIHSIYFVSSITVDIKIQFIPFSDLFVPVSASHNRGTGQASRGDLCKDLTLHTMERDLQNMLVLSYGTI